MARSSDWRSASEVSPLPPALPQPARFMKTTLRAGGRFLLTAFHAAMAGLALQTGVKAGIEPAAGHSYTLT